MKNKYYKSAVVCTSLFIKLLSFVVESYSYCLNCLENSPNPYNLHNSPKHYNLLQYYNSPAPYFSRQQYYPNNLYYLHGSYNSPNLYYLPPPSYYLPQPFYPHYQYQAQRSHNPYYPNRRPYQTTIRILHLDEGDVCRRGRGLYPDYVCANAKNCSGPLADSVRQDNYLDLCTYDGLEPVVCCPTTVHSADADRSAAAHSSDAALPEVHASVDGVRPEAGCTRSKLTADVNENVSNTSSAAADFVDPPVEETSGDGDDHDHDDDHDDHDDHDNHDDHDDHDDHDVSVSVNDTETSISVDKCRQYIAIDYPKIDNYHDPIVGGHPAKPHEYPHMAIIGYGVTTEDKDDWKCSGSLISERWILTAAHCYKVVTLARWARLGDLDIVSQTDDARPADYAIVQHVLHPNYKISQRYNDIALFRLEKDVELSAYVRPICLNVHQYKNPTQQVATGWGRTSTDGSQSNILIEITLDVFPADVCDEKYSSTYDPKLKYGILSDSMICAGSNNDDKDTCSGDSGGPLQTKNIENRDTYTQFGVTSFGSFCGNKELPGVYTRVSKYVPWIEEIVWPNNMIYK